MASIDDILGENPEEIAEHEYDDNGQPKPAEDEGDIEAADEPDETFGETREFTAVRTAEPDENV